MSLTEILANTVHLPIFPTTWAIFRQCIWSVEVTISHLGGSAVYGWLIDAFPNCERPKVLNKVWHCVWQDEDGKVWDIAPYPPDYLRAGFLRDDVAVPVSRDRGDRVTIEPLTNQFVTDDPNWKKACQLLETATNAFDFEENVDKANYYLSKAEKELRRLGWNGHRRYARKDLYSGDLALAV